MTKRFIKDIAKAINSLINIEDVSIYSDRAVPSIIFAVPETCIICGSTKCLGSTLDIDLQSDN